MDEGQAEDRASHISAGFALLTAKLEDAAGLAAAGQRPGPDAGLCDLALQIADLAGDATTVANVLVALLRKD